MGYYDEREYSYTRDYTTTGHRAGLALIATSGLISAISTLFLLTYILRHSFFSRDPNLPMVRGIRSFTHSALGVYLCSLLFSDMIQGAAFAINYKWAADGRMYQSVACQAQGSVSQVGDLGAAIWSLAIAYHTFSLLFLLKKPSVWFTRAVFTVGWILIIVLPIVGPYMIQDLERSGYFYGLSGAWCWIGDGYQLERFLFIYMWIFISLISSIVMYGLVYLRFSGLIFHENGKLTWKSPEKGWSFGRLMPWAVRDPSTTSFHITGSSGSSGTRAPNPEPNGVGKHLKTIAKRLMLYPFVYSIVTVPVAICRLGAMAGWTPPFPLYIFAGITFTCSGLTNVLLFIATRHSFIQQVANIRPRVHVVTQQVTVREDAHGTQTIHLHDLSITTRPEDQDGISEKALFDADIERDGSIKLKHRSPDAGGDVGTPTPVSVRFEAKR
ncbi:hypothetical protein BDV93DRAFT_557237 [Ceratobasidium sp. AG-I]|nr:hypothetical protein BDV93DRAFT_557237 [Ceratobasidium sp. AG-I]